MERLAGTDVDQHAEPDPYVGSGEHVGTAAADEDAGADGGGTPATFAPPAGAPVRARPVQRVVRVVSVEVSLPDQFPTVTLEDTEPTDTDGGIPARLTFRIGTAEGVALAHALAGTTAPRPLTHDLFARALERYAVEILAVRLTGRVGATYLAEVELVGNGGREVLSCRPSDGICIALRQRVAAPVLCDERLFTASGDVLPDTPDGLAAPGGTVGS